MVKSRTTKGNHGMWAPNGRVIGPRVLRKPWGCENLRRTLYRRVLRRFWEPRSPLRSHDPYCLAFWGPIFIEQDGKLKKSTSSRILFNNFWCFHVQLWLFWEELQGGFLDAFFMCSDSVRSISRTKCWGNMPLNPFVWRYVGGVWRAFGGGTWGYFGRLFVTKEGQTIRNNIVELV